MIMWMQKHKKWLVVTIWISTFAFVGAGFVGWGSYNYGSTSGNVAVVGNKEIKVSDLQNQYNTLYRQYQDAFGQTFNQEMAKKLKLEESAFKTLVQKFILINYAQDLGLYITDKDIAKYLVSIPSFLKDGKFDKNTYLQALKQNRNNPTDFENQIRNDLLVQKIQNILSTQVSKTEVDNLAKIALAQDRVSITIINSNKFKIDTSVNNLKKYYEKNKENYKSQESYTIAIAKFKIGNNRKATRKEALKYYLKLKKNEVKFQTTITIAQDNTIFTKDNFNKISIASKNTILKPLENKGYYVVVKLMDTKAPKVLDFQEVKPQVVSQYLASTKQDMLKNEITKVTANFNGQDIGFINNESNTTISTLTPSQSTSLRQSISQSKTIINSVIFNNKAVVYKIKDSKLTNASIQTTELKNMLLNLKNNEVITNLLKQLENKYEVISNRKVN